MKWFATHPVARREAREQGLSLVELSVYVLVFGVLMVIVWSISTSFNISQMRNNEARATSSLDSVLTTQLRDDIQKSTWLYANGAVLKMRTNGQCVTWTAAPASLTRSTPTESMSFGAVASTPATTFVGTGAASTSSNTLGRGKVKLSVVLKDTNAATGGRTLTLDVRNFENGKGPAC